MVKYLMLALAVMSAGLYQNCSKKDFQNALPDLNVNFPSGIPNGQDPTDTDPIDDDDQPPVDQVIASCATANAQGRLQTHVQPIVFEDTRVETGYRDVCQWGAYGNLSPAGGQYRARYEQHRYLNLPANAVICDVNMATDVQRFRYDDAFILTYNDHILASNTKYTIQKSLTPQSLVSLRQGGLIPVYKYNWYSMRGTAWTDDVDDYCLGKNMGAAFCKWPYTEERGPIVFDFDQQILIALGLKAPANQQRFSFITVGDDNPGDDCYHERLSFMMQVKYYTR